MTSGQSKNSFGEYLKAFGQDWSTWMSGPLSVPLAFVAVFVSGWTRVGLLLLSAACLIFASFQIWKNQQKEIARLKVRPYEESQRQLVLGILSSLGEDEREMLRYFVQRGEREQQQISADLNLSQPPFAAAFTSVTKSGLLLPDLQLPCSRLPEVALGSTNSIVSCSKSHKGSLWRDRACLSVPGTYDLHVPFDV
jgi:hypothetical protein